MANKAADRKGSIPRDRAIQTLDYATMMRRGFWEDIAANSQSGLLLVAGAGHATSCGEGSAWFPARSPSPNVISILATDHNDLLASF